MARSALLDACQRVKLITDADYRAGKELLLRLVSMLVKELLLRLVSMLVKLTRSFEAPLLPDKA